MKKNIIADLKRRGFIDTASSDELEEHCLKPVKLYVGFDPTADSLHLGNLVGIIALKWFQLYGHTPYVLMGGATGMIGDPSGKSSERVLLDTETIASNVSSIKKLFERFLSKEGTNAFHLVNNLDWLGKISLIDFLRDVGKQFRLGPMLAKDSVKVRVQSEEGMSFTEFSYQTLQGYDFYHLLSVEGVTLQMGGSDQWGNITAGIEYTRKQIGKSVYGLTFPLLTRSDGKKFGKSEDGAIWLTEDKCSFYDFYQYFMKVPDSDCPKLLRMLTFIDIEEIEKLETDFQNGRLQPNVMQKLLAEEITRFVHGEKGLEVAKKVTGAASFGSSMSLNYEDLLEIAKDFPKKEIALEEVLSQKYVDLACKVGLCPSKGEAVRLIKNQGAYLNNIRVEETGYLIANEDIIGGKFILLGSGKKTKLLVEIKTH